MNIELTLKTKLQEAFKELGLDLSFEDIIIETSKSKEHGDYATNAVLKNSGKLGMKPFELANKLISLLKIDEVDKIEIAGPGFLNFFVKSNQLSSIISNIISLDKDYGRGEKKNKRINVEFVSANPTGNLHVGHARCAAVGDAICRMYEFAGYDITREYYVNDAGNQIHTLGLSLNIRYHQLFGENVELPEDSYHADDIIDIAKEFKEKYGDKYLEDTKENFDLITNYGMNAELEKIWKDLKEYRVSFDVVSKETDIRKNNHVQEVLETKYKQYSYVDGGATFLRTTDFLDDKDRAVVKSDGSYTYLMPDIAYHLNKLERNYDLLIDVLGADHHGYINRMKSALMMQGYSKDILEVELIQVVRLIKDEKEVKMSKRTGAGITLKELCDEVGVDAARYFFVARAASSHLDFDLDLALQHNSSNPVYYAQYAHARLHKVLEIGKDIGIDLCGTNLKEESETELLKCLNEFPQLIESAANKRSPNMVTMYIQKLAGLIHSFYTECRVIDNDNLDVTKSRLALCKASMIVMRNALNVIGVSAPDNM